MEEKFDIDLCAGQGARSQETLATGKPNITLITPNKGPPHRPLGRKLLQVPRHTLTHMSHTQAGISIHADLTSHTEHTGLQTNIQVGEDTRP